MHTHTKVHTYVLRLWLDNRVHHRPYFCNLTTEDTKTKQYAYTSTHLNTTCIRLTNTLIELCINTETHTHTLINNILKKRIGMRGGFINATD